MRKGTHTRRHMVAQGCDPIPPARITARCSSKSCCCCVPSCYLSNRHCFASPETCSRSCQTNHGGLYHEPGRPIHLHKQRFARATAKTPHAITSDHAPFRAGGSAWRSGHDAARALSKRSGHLCRLMTLTSKPRSPTHKPGSTTDMKQQACADKSAYRDLP